VFEYRCELSRVVDGDTVDLWVDLGFNIRVHERFRLAGIDAPESRTRNMTEKALGIAATQFLKQTIEMEAQELKVQTEKDKKGKYGRWIGTLFMLNVKGKWENLNALMVTYGHAIYKEY